MTTPCCPACGITENDLAVGHELAVPLNGSKPTCTVLPPPAPDILDRWTDPASAPCD